MTFQLHHGNVRQAVERRAYLLFLIGFMLLAVPAQVMAETGHGADKAIEHGVAALKSNDFGTAAEHFREAAGNGNSIAQFYLGVLCENGKGVQQNCIEAVKWYSKAAEQGLAVAQINLGSIYGRGFGVPQDYSQAVKWWQKAAEQGDARAQFYLGMMYENGQGVPQDSYTARKLYRKAAEQGIVGAQYRLGLMYYNGRGIRKDFIQAHKWFNLAAAQSNERMIIERRDTVEEMLKPAEVAEAQKLARIWQPKATQATSLGMTCRHNLPLSEAVN